MFWKGKSSSRNQINNVNNVFLFSGHPHEEESRNHVEKGDIIDLDDNNFDITDVKDYKLRNHKSRVTIDQDSDDTDTGPYDDIFDDVELIKIDNADNDSTFKSELNGNKAEDNDTTVADIADDEDITAGSGSGDITIEIEENPQIFNTTDDVTISGIDTYNILCLCTISRLCICDIARFQYAVACWHEKFCLLFYFLISIFLYLRTYEFLSNSNKA